MAKNRELGWVRIIQAVQTPLGFFTLIVLVIEGALALLVTSNKEPERTYLTAGMLGLLVLLIVTVGLIAYFRPQTLGPRAEEQSLVNRLSVIVGPPIGDSWLDITTIEWDSAQCFIVGHKLKEQITLVPSPVGPSFRVHFPKGIWDRLDAQESYELDLRDKKQNRWRVKPFYLFETVVPLSSPETKEKLRADYNNIPDDQ